MRLKRTPSRQRWVKGSMLAASLVLALAVGPAGVRAADGDAVLVERGNLRDTLQFAARERELIRDWVRRARREGLVGRVDTGLGRDGPGRTAPAANSLTQMPAQEQAARSFRGASPGLRYRLERGDRLPAGVTRQYLPEELVRHLPHHAGHDRVVYGEDIYLVQRGTGLVQDVLRGAMRE
jgi:hypothetical protein